MGWTSYSNSVQEHEIVHKESQGNLVLVKNAKIRMFYLVECREVTTRTEQKKKFKISHFVVGASRVAEDT